MPPVLTPVQDPAPPPSPWELGGRAPGRRRRLLLASGVAFALVTAVFGPPTGREVVAAWVLVFLYAVVGGDRQAWKRAVLRDWLPLLAFLFGYDLLRGFADDLVARAHVLPQLRADEWLFGWALDGQVPTVWLQAHLYRPDPSWYDDLTLPVYLSYFLVPLAVLAGLWARSYARFRQFAVALVLLTVATLATYAAFPAVPPWLASSTTDLLPPVVRVPSHTIAVSGFPTIHNALQRGEVYGNPVAAVPSLHSAVPMLILLLSWPYARALGRSLLTLYVLAMTFTLVYGGEHYVFDVLVGWAYAVLAVAGTALLARRAAARRAAASAPPG